MALRIRHVSPLLVAAIDRKLAARRRAALTAPPLHDPAWKGGRAFGRAMARVVMGLAAIWGGVFGAMWWWL